MTNNRIGQTDVTTDDLQLYFDDELGGAEARELAAQIEAEPELKAELEQLGIISGIVSAGLMAKAQEVPQARFEQIWDEIDRTIERDARQADASSASPSLWARLAAAFKPWRVPVAAALGAAAAVVVVTNMGSDSDSTGASTNNSPIASSEKRIDKPAAENPSSLPPSDSNPAQTPEDATPDMVAEDMTPEAPDVFPEPKSGEAEIHEVEFGGKGGRISSGGTVTVLWVDEDAEPKDSERSL
jgi:hypothetical protein